MKPIKKPPKETDALVASLMPDSDEKLRNIAGVSLLVALALGFWATTYQEIIDEHIFEKSGPAEIVTTLDITQKMEEKKPKEEKKQDKKPPKPDRHVRPGGGGKPKGEGKPHAPETRGVLRELTAMTKSVTASAYDLMQQKVVKDIDKVLKNTNGLQVTGKTTIGDTRRGVVNAGFNEGVAAGGSGGLGDALGNLFGPASGGPNTKSMKGNMRTPNVRDIDIGSGPGSRSASDIMKVVRQRTPGLRHIYNKHLKKNPGFEGKVTIKFTIAPGGEIISIAIVSSTTGYSAFDDDIRNMIASWTFNKVKSGNTTVTVPFTFTE